MAAAALALAGLAGCSDKTPVSRLDGASGDPASVTPPPAASVVGKDDGLEVRWWITEAGGDALLGALGAELSNPVPVDDRTREILAANGFRVVAVPLEAVDRLPSKLRPVGSVQQQRLAQTGVWTDVARGPTWQRAHLLTMHDGPLELPAGRLRLLARGWLTPMPAAEGGRAVESTVSFELVPQHEDQLGAGEKDVSDLSLVEPDPTPQGQGVMFWRLALRGRLRPGEALVILAEDPFERWSEGEEDPPAPAPGEGAAAHESTKTPIGRVIRGNEERAIVAPTPTPAPDPGARHAPLTGPVAGPPSLDSPTIGEALMLARSGGGSGRASTRAIVVLVPRTPENFRLLGGR